MIPAEAMAKGLGAPLSEGKYTTGGRLPQVGRPFVCYSVDYTVTLFASTSVSRVFSGRRRRIALAVCT